MTRHHRFAAPLFLALAVVLALGLFTPQSVGAIDPKFTDSTTIYTPYTPVFGKPGVSDRITETSALCVIIGDVATRATATTATFTFTSVCPVRTMVIINREVSPAPLADGQIIEQTDTTQHALTLSNLTPGTGYRYRLLLIPNGGGSATEFDAGRFETEAQGPLRDPNRAPHTGDTPPAQLTRLTVTPLGFNEFGPLTRFDLQTSQAADVKIVLWAYGVQTRRINVPNAQQGASVTVQSQEDCRTYAYQITLNGQVAKQGTFQTNRPNYGCHDAIPFPSANPNP